VGTANTGNVHGEIYQYGDDARGMTFGVTVDQTMSMGDSRKVVGTNKVNFLKFRIMKYNLNDMVNAEVFEIMTL
jgi:hypothetical protein